MSHSHGEPALECTIPRCRYPDAKFLCGRTSPDWQPGMTQGLCILPSGHHSSRCRDQNGQRFKGWDQETLKLLGVVRQEEGEPDPSWLVVLELGNQIPGILAKLLVEAMMEAGADPRNAQLYKLRKEQLAYGAGKVEPGEVERAMAEAPPWAKYCYEHRQVPAPQPPRLALDEDPDEALRVITGQARGNKTYAAICLADAIAHGNYPAGWSPDSKEAGQ